MTLDRIETKYPTPRPILTAGKKLSQTVAEADKIARDVKLMKLEIEERLAELGFSQIKTLPDCVTASLNGVSYRLGA